MDSNGRQVNKYSLDGFFSSEARFHFTLDCLSSHDQSFLEQGHWRIQYQFLNSLLSLIKMNATDESVLQILSLYEL